MGLRGLHSADRLHLVMKLVSAANQPKKNSLNSAYFAPTPESKMTPDQFFANIFGTTASYAKRFGKFLESLKLNRFL
jgi:hypothetical protein